MMINGVRNLPIKFNTFDRFITNRKTSKKYIILVNQELVPKKGSMAISWVTEAVLGAGNAMEIV